MTAPVPWQCHICHEVHDACRFGGGSLYCLAGDNCKNPHHKKRRIT